MQRLPTWDEYYLEVAKAVAQRSDCSLSSAGAVIVAHDQRLVATGFQSTGTENCLDGNTCHAGCEAEHAEIIALANADPARIPGGAVYATARPCGPCIQRIDATTLHRVVWPDGSHPTRAYWTLPQPTGPIRQGWDTLNVNG